MQCGVVQSNPSVPSSSSSSSGCRSLYLPQILSLLRGIPKAGEIFILNFLIGFPGTCLLNIPCLTLTRLVARHILWMRDILIVTIITIPIQHVIEMDTSLRHDNIRPLNVFILPYRLLFHSEPNLSRNNSDLL